MQKITMRQLFGVIIGIVLILASERNCQGQGTAVDASPYNGKKIRSIQVKVRDIFDEDDIGSAYKIANDLKISTAENVIRRELLYQEGDVYDEFLIKESERNLRSLGFLTQVQTIRKLDGDEIDLLVEVQDAWTIIPQITYSVGDGGNKYIVGASEADLLGLGKRVEVLYADVEGREEIQSIFEDRRFLDSYNRLLGAYFARSDGHKALFQFGRPFRSLVEKESWIVTLNQSDVVNKLYESGDTRFAFREEALEVGAGYTIARGDPKEALHRYTFGYEFSENLFSEATEKDLNDVGEDPDAINHDPSLLASNRRFSSPVFSYRRIVPDFISLNFVDRFERVQDFNLGSQLIFNSAIAPKFIGSEDDTLLLSGGILDGHKFTRTSFIRGGVGAGSRVTDTGSDNDQVWGELRYYNVLGTRNIGDIPIGHHTLAAGLTADYANDLDKDAEFLLGAGNGLRGYSSKALSGDKRFIFSCEDRMHLYDDLLRIVSVGASVFFDAGGTTRDNYDDIFTNGLYSDIGFGFRFGFPRVTGGGIARAEVALPLRDADDGSNAFEPRFLFTVGLPFSSELRGESAINDASSVQIGVD